MSSEKRIYLSKYYEKSELNYRFYMAFNRRNYVIIEKRS